MTAPAYPAARETAARVHPHFARDIAEARRLRRRQVAPLPNAGEMETIIDAGFWASLRREEGYSPRISLAFLPPQRSGGTLHFERPLPLAPSTLVPLAPAVEGPGIHLGVWPEGGELCVWGATRAIPAFCFVLEVVAPGLLVVKHRRAEESAKFRNVAVIEGDQVKVVDPQGAALNGCPSLVTALLGSDSADYPADSVDVLVQIAIFMRAHGHGGTLLIVPADSDGWRQSIVTPVRYPMAPPYSGLSQLLRDGPDRNGRRRWQDAVRRATQAIGALTSVDGATVITARHEILAFGVKLGRALRSPQVEAVTLLEAVEGAAPRVVAPSELGGTRHLSAAQFAHDQRDTVAMVASQDGRFTIFQWSGCEGMVGAHRVEALLL